MVVSDARRDMCSGVGGGGGGAALCQFLEILVVVRGGGGRWVGITRLEENNW